MNEESRSVLRAYAARRTATRRATAIAVHRAFLETADPDDIADSFDEVAERVAPLIVEGQRTTVAQTGGYLRHLSFVQTGGIVEPLLPDVVGLTQKGLPILAGMGALGPMVLGAIRDGESLDQAMAFGGYLFGRFADSEVTRVADEVIEAQFGYERGGVIGWEGIVAGNSCDPCTANDGFHSLGDEMYRHGNCQCERIAVYEGSTPIEPGAQPEIAEVEAVPRVDEDAPVRPVVDPTETEAFQRALADPEYRRVGAGERSDRFLTDMGNEMGFGGKPDVVTRDELDRFIAAGEKELWRGETKAEYAAQFLYGDYRVGLGQYGNGIYTAWGAEAEQTAEMFGRGDTGLLHMTLKADARVIDYKEASARALPVAGRYDVGRWAMTQGFDAIRVDYAAHGFGEGGEYVILNRTAVRVATP